MNLSSLLPQHVGAPLPLRSLREDLQVSHTAIRSYIKALELTAVLFQSFQRFGLPDKRRFKSEKTEQFSRELLDHFFDGLGTMIERW